MDSIPWAVAWMVNLPSVSPDVNSPSSEIVAPAALRATNAEQQTAKALPTAQDRLQFGRQAVDDIVPQVAEKWLTQQAELSNTPVGFRLLPKEESPRYNSEVH